MYLVHVERKKLNFPDLLKKVKQLSKDYSPETILIEDTAAGTGLIQQLRQEGIFEVSAVSPKGEKKQRFIAQTAKIESGFVHVMQDQDWTEPYIAELTSFPNDTDDQVDSTTNFLKWMGDEADIPGMGLQHFYEQEVARQQQGSGTKLVRVKMAKPGTYQFNVWPGTIHAGEDPVEVSEEIAEELRHAGGVIVG